MATLLRIDSSPMHATSVSRHLTENFADKWKQQHPDGRIIARDLTTLELRPISAAWVGASYTPEAARTEEQRQLLALSDQFISELKAADEYVIGVPMHNFSVPSTLKLWIDQIVRAGRTFSYINGAPKGLLLNKKATFLVASGGVYDAGTAMASMNFVEPYLRTLFAFMGVTQTSFINAGGTSQLNSGVDRGTFLRPHIDKIEAHFRA